MMEGSLNQPFSCEEKKIGANLSHVCYIHCLLARSRLLTNLPKRTGKQIHHRRPRHQSLQGSRPRAKELL